MLLKVILRPLCYRRLDESIFDNNYCISAKRVKALRLVLGTFAEPIYTKKPKVGLIAMSL
jgi:hypothetical protein